MNKCLHVIHGNKEGDKRARGGRGVRKNVQEEAPQNLVLLYDKPFWVLWILVRLGRDRTRKGGEDRSFRFCVGRDGSGERGGGAKAQRERRTLSVQQPLPKRQPDLDADGKRQAEQYDTHDG